MLILLDTDVCIHLMNRRPGFERVLRRLSGRTFGEICISAITVSELRYGVAKSAKHRENSAALDEFLSRFEVLDYPVEAGDSYGRIRTDLETAGKPVGNNDLLIAAHALTIGARVATANKSEFERVPGVKAVDWLS